MNSIVHSLEALIASWEGPEAGLLKPDDEVTEAMAWTFQGCADDLRRVLAASGQPELIETVQWLVTYGNGGSYATSIEAVARWRYEKAKESGANAGLQRRRVYTYRPHAEPWEDVEG